MPSPRQEIRLNARQLTCLSSNVTVTQKLNLGANVRFDADPDFLLVLFTTFVTLSLSSFTSLVSFVHLRAQYLRSIRTRPWPTRKLQLMPRKFIETQEF